MRAAAIPSPENTVAHTLSAVLDTRMTIPLSSRSA